MTKWCYPQPNLRLIPAGDIMMKMKNQAINKKKFKNRSAAQKNRFQFQFKKMTP